MSKPLENGIASDEALRLQLTRGSRGKTSAKAAIEVYGASGKADD